MFKLKKNSLFIILTFCLVLLFSTIGVWLLYFTTNVEKLANNYPYFDSKTQEYKFSKTKPKDWVEIGKISKYAKWAILVSEDWAFYDHKGLDLHQMENAIKQSIHEERLVRGASTITQQVIKNTILSSERSIWRKIREAILSYKVEKYLDKDKILEIYLNIVELGENIYGIKKASYYYFNKAPSHLTAREGAFLAMLLPSPKKYSVSFRRKELTPFATEVINSIMIKLRQANIYTEDERLLEMDKRFYWEKVPEEVKEKNEDENSINDFEFYEYEI